MKTPFKLIIATIIILSTAACKKEGPIGPQGDPGPQGAQGPTGAQGPDAYTKEYTLTYYSGDTYKTYSGFTGMYDAGDMIVSYAYWTSYGSDPYYVQLPFIKSGWSIYPEVNNNTGSIFMNIEDASNGSSVITSTSNFKFKSILVKGSIVKRLPDGFDFSDHELLESYIQKYQYD